MVNSVKMETLKKKYSNKNSSKVREIMVRIQATPAIKLEASPLRDRRIKQPVSPKT